MKSVNVPRSVFSFSCFLSVASLIALLPTNSILRILTRPLVHVERDVDQFGPPGTSLMSVRDGGELESPSPQHVADDALDLAHQGGVDEGVEADLGVGVLQLLVDLRHFNLLGADVVDDLDALPLLHVVRDDLPIVPLGNL